MTAPPQAIAPNPHTNLLSLYIQIANKMGFKKTKESSNVQDRLMGRNHEVDWLTFQDTHTKFHEYRFSHSKVDEGTHMQPHTQTARRFHKPTYLPT
jgi:hypothetical protein